MINEKGKNAPAPWVAWSRAGCDVGAFSIANIEFESIPVDVVTVFGDGSPEANEANSNRTWPPTSRASRFTAPRVARCAPRATPGPASCPTSRVAARASTRSTAPEGSAGDQSSGPVKDLDGNVVADSSGNPGFDPTATQSLGYVATMLEAGVRSSTSTFPTLTTTSSVRR